jgi:hypothetical protein
LGRFPAKIIAVAVIEFSYLLFMPLSTEARKCDFCARHNGVVCDTFSLDVYLPLPNEDFGSSNKRKMRLFDALFKGMSTQFWPLTIEKSIENPHYIFCSSFQNLRLGGVNLQWEA